MSDEKPNPQPPNEAPDSVLPDEDPNLAFPADPRVPDLGWDRRSSAPPPAPADRASASPIGRSSSEGAPSYAPAPVDLTPLRILLGLLQTVRPHQWVKNVFVLAPVAFAKEILEQDFLLRAFGAFGVFCVLAGAVYTMNDLVDQAADREHPVKRFRPIASGQVPRSAAIVAVVLLVLLGLGGASLGPPQFLVVTAAYFLINIGYSFGLKNVAYLDVSIISLGFVLRVLAGGFATATSVSAYIIACTAVLALFLGFGKRRHELATAEERKRRGKKQRAVLENYSRRGLDVALGLTAVVTVGTYVVYTLDSRTREFFRSDSLWWTSAFVVLGVARFLFLVLNRPKAESPTQEMLKDGPFVAVVLVWAAVVMGMVYNLRPAG